MTHPEPEFGLELPGYEILREVGRGGVSTVYLARHELMGRQVAIKLMSPVLAVEEGFNKRFVREGQTVARLKHPGIVTVYDVSVLHYRPFIAMEYLPGGSLKDRMTGPYPPEQAIALLRTIADSLGYAHSRGVFHRDVKPENILFRDNGEPVLTDFGIAKSDSQDTALTSIGVVVGTPRYISPEQAQGFGSDARSDIYALGVMLHEMLTGRPPYDVKGSMSLLYAHINEPIPRLPEELAGYQDLLDDLLAKDPDKRISDCAVLVERLDEAVDTAPSRRKAPRPGKKRSRRGKWPTVVLAGLAVPAVVLVLWSEGYRFGAGWPPAEERSFKEMVGSLTADEESRATDLPASPGFASSEPAMSEPVLPESAPPGPVLPEFVSPEEYGSPFPHLPVVVRREPVAEEESTLQWKLASRRGSTPQTNDTPQPADEREAADGLDAQSIYNQAQALLSSRAAEANRTAAARLHEQAASMGHPVSQYYLGVAYANGDGVERDETRARHWLKLAAVAGVQGAKYNLILADIFGSQRDPGSAAKMALQLAEQKYTPVYRILGWMYNTGTGVDSSFAQSVRWSVKKMVGDVTGQNGPRWVVRRWERQLEAELSKIEIKPSPVKPIVK